MTFSVDYNKFTILSKVRDRFTIRIFRRANIAHKPTFSIGGYFSSVTLNMREDFKWIRAKVKPPLKGFSFLFVCCVCVAIFSLVICYYYYRDV